jgi:hypothetical protein
VARNSIDPVEAACGPIDHDPEVVPDEAMDPPADSVSAAVEVKVATPTPPTDNPSFEPALVERYRPVVGSAVKASEGAAAVPSANGKVIPVAVTENTCTPPIEKPITLDPGRKNPVFGCAPKAMPGEAAVPSANPIGPVGPNKPSRVMALFSCRAKSVIVGFAHDVSMTVPSTTGFDGGNE